MIALYSLNFDEVHSSEFHKNLNMKGFRMKHKTILVSMALSALLLSGSYAGSVAGTGGALESTQLLNYAKLADSYVKQTGQYAAQLQQYETQVQQFVQQVNTDKMILQNIGQLPRQQWDQFTRGVIGMKNIIQNTQGMSYQAGSYNQLYKPYDTLTSGALDPTNIYKQLSKKTNATVKDALAQLDLQTSDMDTDAEALSKLQNLSQSAKGQLGAIQAANAIAINQIQTLRKLQQTMVTQANMMAQQMAAQQLEKDTDKANASKWLGGDGPTKPLTTYGNRKPTISDQLP